MAVFLSADSLSSALLARPSKDERKEGGELFSKSYEEMEEWMARGAAGGSSPKEVAQGKVARWKKPGGSSPVKITHRTVARQG